MDPQQTTLALQKRGLTAKRKTIRKQQHKPQRKRPLKNVIQKSAASKIKVVKPMKMRKNQHKNAENSKSQSSFSPPVDCNTSTARAQNWAEAEMDELTEAGFRKWVIMNSTELKDYVLTHCKETKSHDKTLQVLLIRRTSLERNINDLIEMKNTTQELYNANTSINS